MVKSCYVHLPFCTHLCSYCDFAKFYYNSTWANQYLDALEKEIEENYRGETLETIYVGGGTPSSLSYSQLEKLFQILGRLKFASSFEFTVECNVENLTEEKLRLMMQYGVNRLSIGVESSHPDRLQFLGRPYTKEDIQETIQLAKKVGFSNLNVDLIYALPGEDKKELEEDLSFLLSLDVSHLSTYSLMIQNNTKLSLQGYHEIDQDLDRTMYEIIHHRLTSSGYCHYEISNFAKPGYESKHNLVYWRNEEYYGFGLGASGYLSSVRYTNTRSLTEYIKKNFHREREKITPQLDRENEIMLGFRMREGVNKERFQKKFGKDLKELYADLPIWKEAVIEETTTSYRVPYSYWYVLDEILVYFIEE